MDRQRQTGRRRALGLAAPFATVALVLAACATGGGSGTTAASPTAVAEVPSEAPAGAPTLEGTNWQLTGYAGPQGNTVPVPELVAATAVFEGGTVSGNAGCNSYNGSYTLEGDTITVGGLALTKMACPDVQMALESAFTTMLGNVESWSIRADVLELQTEGGKVGLTFVAAENPALTGTRWVATGINNGKGAVTSVVGGVEVTAVFAEDGNVAGSGGCNGYSASYTVDGSSITIGPTAGTMMACADDVNTQETAYYAALAAATTFGFRDGNLELRDDGGALQVSYRATMP